MTLESAGEDTVQRPPNAGEIRAAFPSVSDAPWTCRKGTEVGRFLGPPGPRRAYVSCFSRGIICASVFPSEKGARDF